jgi:cytochrome c peroxidase
MEAGHWISTFRKTAAIIGAVVFAIGVIEQISSVALGDWESFREKYQWPTSIPYPKDDPYSEVKFELGRMLFFDPVLSGSEDRSCANCHNPALSWADGQPRAIGLTQQSLPLRTPTLLGVAWIPKLGWTGHFRELESVAITPITARQMMNLPETLLIERLSEIRGYVDAFKDAFPDGDINRSEIEQALATFERSIVPTQAPIDRWINGDTNAMSQSAVRGFDLFNGKANCAACHSGWAFTDGTFHDIGTAQGDDLGRGKLFPTSVALRYAFKTPTLRDVARRAPYMHDGSVPTLAAVIELYNRGGIDRPSRSPEIHPLNLTANEKTDLIAFLETLSGGPASVRFSNLPR